MTDPQELINQATTICEAATPGPWVAECPYGTLDIVGAGATLDPRGYANGEFIATSRTLLPQLAEALKESEATVATLLGRHQVASIAVASGLEPDATLDELYEHLSELRQATRERDEARAKLAHASTKPSEYFAAQMADCMGFSRTPMVMGPFLERACELSEAERELTKLKEAT